MLAQRLQLMFDQYIAIMLMIEPRSKKLLMQTPLHVNFWVFKGGTPRPPEQ